MLTIDQRILIPVPAHRVWAYISNLENLPNWQADCENITFLSQRRVGLRSRWRQKTANRQEMIYEISAWYDGLGYEYDFVDGAVFKAHTGRLRLQEIPEGTIVQWTVTYELTGGLLGGLRHAGFNSRFEKMMIDSLKTLWKLSKQFGSMANYESRSAMRDGAQNAEERAKRRRAETPTEPSRNLLLEPPITEGDTRPRMPAVQVIEPMQAVDETRFAPPTVTIIAEPNEQELLPLPSLGMPVAEVVPVHEPEPRFGIGTTGVIEIGDPIRISSPTPDVKEDIPILRANDGLPNLPMSAPAPGEAGYQSIWEVFGIPSPTDSQRMRAIQAAQVAEEEYQQEQRPPVAPPPLPLAPLYQSQPIITDVLSTQTLAAAAPEHATESPTSSQPFRFGLRQRQRQNTVKLRRPQP